jgi:hypothetical protein
MDLEVRKDGKLITCLNHYLVRKQGLDQDQVDYIKDLHIELHERQMSIADKDVLTEAEATVYIDAIENLEFQLQEAWGFPRDANRHTNWFLDPNCDCAKLDNRDALGCVERYYNSGCKVHGEKKDDSLEILRKAVMGYTE